MDETLRSRLAAVSTTSLVDAAASLRVLPATLRPVVPGRPFCGQVVTAAANRDLMSVMAGLLLAGPGDVLVVDAGGDDRAVAGELFATEAQRRGVAALVLFGRCRDSATLAALEMPVWATGVAPNAYPATALPVTGVELSLSGIPVRPGEILAGDDDGLVLGSAPEMDAAVARAEAIEEREKALQRRILAGDSLFDSLNYEEHLGALRAGRPGGLAFG